jgi:hypothetical protein
MKRGWQRVPYTNLSDATAVANCRTKSAKEMKISAFKNLANGSCKCFLPGYAKEYGTESWKLDLHRLLKKAASQQLFYLYHLLFKLPIQINYTNNSVLRLVNAVPATNRLCLLHSAILYCIACIAIAFNKIKTISGLQLYLGAYN